MKYVRISRGQVSAYPYDLNMLRNDYPTTSFPRIMPEERWAQYNVFPVKEVPEPKPSDPLFRDVVEVNPTLIDGVWTQTWDEVEVGADEILRRNVEAQDVAVIRAAKADRFVQVFRNMTIAEVESIVDESTPGVPAPTRLLLKRMAVMLAVLIRREFRD